MSLKFTEALGYKPYFLENLVLPLEFCNQSKTLEYYTIKQSAKVEDDLSFLFDIKTFVCHENTNLDLLKQGIQNLESVIYPPSPRHTLSKFCPKCNSTLLKPIHYGLIEDSTPVEQRDYICGGCEMHSTFPHVACTQCNYQWQWESN